MILKVIYQKFGTRILKIQWPPDQDTSRFNRLMFKCFAILIFTCSGSVLCTLQCSVVLKSTDARHRLGTSSCISRLDRWTPWTLVHAFSSLVLTIVKMQYIQFSEWNKDIRKLAYIRYITIGWPIYLLVFLATFSLPNTDFKVQVLH